MGDASDTVIERATVREVTGVFHAREALDAAIDALLLAGFDRADIDVVASIDEVREKLGIVYVAAEDLADVPSVPRRPVIRREDITLARVVVVGIVAFAAAAAVALWVVASGASAETAAVWAIVTAIAVTGISVLLVGLLSRDDAARGLDAIMEARGLILWVRVRSPEREAQAQEILLAHGATAVRVHQITIDKRLEEIPFSSLRPDPWLGDERLGQP